ncbi:cell wall hydrolase [Ammoniphilus resinae]|uniref:Spore germination cell wall hydrolase CwlJ-like protein n=1 Tax=Ammoniphilus resinae TaxID=861532 RepID=A0ABS4GII4_9BACL|nr:cell wall hydrolase [Ammoniphilus resinae]MBP1930061.1 spore germination cell wall hydrolase CwlJ-like protein [Ammoniphilus resinae]
MNKLHLRIIPILLFFVGSIGILSHSLAYAKELDQATKQPVSHGVTKKIRNNPFQNDLIVQKKIQAEKITHVEKVLKPKKKVQVAKKNPSPKKQVKLPSRSAAQINRSYTLRDLNWLSKIIHAEAKGEPFKGKVAVGAVIINRTENKQFPNQIYDVIHQSRNGRYQFQPVANGAINDQPDQESIAAAKQALSGSDPTNGAIYFYNPKISRSHWMDRLQRTARIGNHVFAVQ